MSELTPELKEPRKNDFPPVTDAYSLKDESGGKAVNKPDDRWKQNRVSRWIEIAAGSLFQSPIS